MAKKALVLASVASMICQFNMNNIDILRDLGYEVTVTCNFVRGSSCDSARIEKFKAELTEKGVKYIQTDFVRSPFDIPGNLKAYRQLKRLLKNERFDLIHCHTPMASILCRLAAKKYRKTGRKVIYTAHGFHFFKGAPLINWLLYYPAEKYCSRFTDILVTINHEDFVLAKRKMRAKQVEYIPGVGIDVEKFAAVTVDRAAKRRDIGVPEDAFLLISVGELIPRKNHTVVLEAVSDLINKKNLTDIHYVICGQGVLESELKAKADRLNLSGNVHFLGYRTDIAEICKCSDLFVFMSKQEGLPVALMEAMACGLPVVCSKIRGNTDLAADGKSGRLIGSGDVGGLVLALSGLIADRHAADEMGQYNYNIINRFDVESVNLKMKEIYNENNTYTQL